MQSIRHRLDWWAAFLAAGGHVNKDAEPEVTNYSSLPVSRIAEWEEQCQFLPLCSGQHSLPSHALGPCYGIVELGKGGRGCGRGGGTPFCHPQKWSSGYLATLITSAWKEISSWKDTYWDDPCRCRDHPSITAETRGHPWTTSRREVVNKDCTHIYNKNNVYLLFLKGACKTLQLQRVDHRCNIRTPADSFCSHWFVLR